MSLKHFHILFIAIAALFCGLFAAWCLLAEGEGRSIRVMGWASLAAFAALVAYFPWFYKKAKRVLL